MSYKEYILFPVHQSEEMQKLVNAKLDLITDSEREEAVKRYRFKGSVEKVGPEEKIAC